MKEVYFFKLDSLADNGKTNRSASEAAMNFVKLTAAKNLGIEYDSTVISRNKNGKPYLADFPNFHFNISHSKNGIAIAFSDSPIGVDIEYLRSADLRVAERFFSEKEKNYIKDSSAESDRHFFEIWTKKEAFIKKNGLSIKNLRDADSSNIFTCEIEGYIISVCSDSEEKINIITL